MPSKKYPHSCCRCGFCCLTEQCPISIKMFGKKNLCPSLSFTGTEAACGLPELVPFGDGCCMLARCYSRGQCYLFASLKKEIKISIAQSLKAGKLIKSKKEEN